MEKTGARLQTFKIDGIDRPVSFRERSGVTDGVVCDVYSFIDDNRRDLRIINIDSGKKTLLQRVLKGDRTIEGYTSGKGKLIITKQNGQVLEYVFDGKTELSKTVPVSVGETMQWEADRKSKLRVFKICYPPYEDGRFENLTQ